MKSVLQGLVLAALLAVIAVPAVAGDKKNEDGKKPAAKKEGEKKKKPEAKKADPAETLAANILKRLGKVELTAAQTEEIKKLAATYAPKITEARKKANLTPEQAKARQEAMKKAKDEGKSRKDAIAAVEAAVSLSADQKSAMEEARKLQAEFSKAAMGVLTDEQRKQVAPGRAKPKKDNA